MFFAKRPTAKKSLKIRVSGLLVFADFVSCFFFSKGSDDTWQLLVKMWWQPEQIGEFCFWKSNRNFRGSEFRRLDFLLVTDFTNPVRHAFAGVNGSSVPITPCRLSPAASAQEYDFVY